MRRLLPLLGPGGLRLLRPALLPALPALLPALPASPAAFLPALPALLPALPAASGARGMARNAAQPPAEPERDWVGPPDRDSNLRPVLVGRRPGESALEQRLRELRGDTETWSQRFWSEHNRSFSREKEAFIVNHLREKGLATHDENGLKRSLGVDEMSEFYKRFLDDSRAKHLAYNKEWYRRNLSITWMMARVALLRAWRFARGGGRPR